MKTILTLIAALLLVTPGLAKDYGPIYYSTTVASGFEDDTLLVPELYLYAGATDLVGKYLWVSKTTDGAAPQNEACLILEHTASSGQLVLDAETEGAGNDASLGLSASITLGDYIYVMDTPPPGALIRSALVARKMATGIPDRDALLYATNVIETCSSYVADGTSEIDTTLENVRGAALAIHTAIADGTGEIDTTLENSRAGITAIETLIADGTSELDTTLENSRTAIGRIEADVDDVIDTLTVQSTAIDRIEVDVDTINSVKLEYAEDLAETTRDSLSYLHDLMWGATGLPAVTGAKIVAAGGISLAEGLVDMADVLAEIDTSGDANQAAITVIQTIADALQDANEWQILTGYVDLVKSDSVWSSVATHEVFTFPAGRETEFELAVRCSTAVTGADSIKIALGSTSVYAFAKNDMVAGDYVTWPADFSAYRVEDPSGGIKLASDATAGSAVLRGVSYGTDIGYEVQTSTVDPSAGTGYLIWTLRYRDRGGDEGATSDVANGAGGAL